MPWCRYATQTAAALQKLAADGTAVAVLPMGAVEQHGPHLPVGTDFYSAEDLTYLAMEKVTAPTQYFVLPTITYALSTEHIHVPGTITLSYDTVIQTLVDIGRSLLRLNVRKLVVVNGHGGNDAALQIAGRVLRGEGMRMYMVDGGKIRTALGAQEYHIHADKFETSAMLAMHPEMVDTAQISPELTKSIEKWHQSADYRGDLISYWYIEDVAADGVVGDPDLASAEYGREFLQQQSAKVAAALDLAAAL